LLIAAAALIVLGLLRISFNVEILDLLPPDIDQAEGLATVLENFGLPNELIVTVETPDATRTASAATSLAAHLRTDPALTQLVVDQPLWEAEPEKLADFAAYTAINLPPAEFQKIVTALDPTNAPANAQSAVDDLTNTLSGQELALLSYDPYRILPHLQAIAPTGDSATKSEFVSADGTFRAIYVTATPDLANYRLATDWIAAVQTNIADWKQSQPDPAKIQIGIAGDPAFVSELSSGMETEMRQSGLITAAIVGLIFFAVYRRFIPLVILIALLGLSFVIALALAGFIESGITIISAGFASILVGINVDYGLIIYQTHRNRPTDATTLRRHCTPGIAWAAATTAAAFASLTLSGVPGLAQLGLLVALGVLAGATLMLTLFTRAVVRFSPIENRKAKIENFPALKIGAAITATVVVLAVSALLIKGFPGLESTAAALQPRNSLAYATVDRIYEKLADSPRTLNLLVTGDNPTQIHDRLLEATISIEKLQAEGLIESALLPTAFWPDPAAQQANLAAIQPALAARNELASALETAGFTDAAFAFTQALLDQWATISPSPPPTLTPSSPIWPTDSRTLWILRRAIHRPDAALGAVEPAASLSDADYAALPAKVNAPGIALLGWPLLGQELARFAAEEMIFPFAIFAAVLLVMLILAFRNAFDVLFAIGILVLNSLTLLGGMTLLGFTWNFMNIAAGLLLLGTGVDFSIHLIRSLRETNGDLVTTHRTVGTALLLCGLTTTIGFASISWATSEGLASLGRVCALGFAANTAIAIFLLPRLWVQIQMRLNRR
jgi:predicted RND superfamily exporter protein